MIDLELRRQKKAEAERQVYVLTFIDRPVAVYRTPEQAAAESGAEETLERWGRIPPDAWVWGVWKITRVELRE